MNPTKDSVLRGMTDDGAFRVVAARTTDTVRGALAAQHATGDNARYLGELLTGAVLVRETMAPKHRVQGLLHTRDRRGQLVADAHPDGGTRGLLRLSNGLSQISLDGATLEMMRTLYTGEIHRGLVRIPRATGISQALMTYMLESEQVASMISVACVMDAQGVVAAGGYIVQLLPEVDRSVLSVMTERLRDFENIDKILIDNEAAPGPLMEEILYGMAFTRLQETPLSFKCRCDRVRVMSTLASLGRDELTQMIKEGEGIELNCDYCGQRYAVNPPELRGLLDRS